MRPSFLPRVLACVAAAVLFNASAVTAGDVAATVPTAFAEAGDVTYAHRLLGPAGDAPPLVLVTRYRANMDDWDPAFLDALARTRRVVVFNQSGIASSSGSVPDTIGGMAADVARFIEAMGWTEVDLLGWSMGGFTAQAVLADYPDLVRRAILVGTGPAASEQTPGPKDGVFEVATRASRADGRTTYSDADRQYLFFSDAPEHAALAAASLARIDAARREDEPVSTPDVMAAQTAAIERFWFDESTGYFEALSDVSQPVLIINGDSDAFFTVGAQEVLFSQIPDARLAILPGAGHGPQHQEPDYVAGMIARFLD